MEDLVIKPSKKTPLVKCLAEEQQLVMSGVSIQEDAVEFFQPIQDWVKAYFKTPKPLTIDINLMYFNTASSHMITNILGICESSAKLGSVVKVLWHYEEGDIDIQDIGEDYAEVFPSLAFSHIMVDIEE